MDREERKEKELIPKGIAQGELISEEPFVFGLGEIPEAELMDYDNEKAQIIMYSKWDRIFNWFRRLAEKIDK